MEHIDVEWIHKNAAYPVRQVSELDTRLNEIRKLEFLLEGKLGFATQHRNSPCTELGVLRSPLFWRSAHILCSTALALALGTSRDSCLPILQLGPNNSFKPKPFSGSALFKRNLYNGSN